MVRTGPLRTFGKRGSASPGPQVHHFPLFRPPWRESEPFGMEPRQVFTNVVVDAGEILYSLAFDLQPRETVQLELWTISTSATGTLAGVEATSRFPTTCRYGASPSTTRRSTRPDARGTPG